MKRNDADRGKVRRRLREAITTSQRFLQAEIETGIEEGSYKREAADLAKEHRELLDGLARFRLMPMPRSAVPWHYPAELLAAEFHIVLLPGSPFSWDTSRESPLIRFVQQALQWIGVPKMITRSAIVKALALRDPGWP